MSLLRIFRITSTSLRYGSPFLPPPSVKLTPLRPPELRCYADSHGHQTTRPLDSYARQKIYFGMERCCPPKDFSCFWYCSGNHNLKTKLCFETSYRWTKTIFQNWINKFLYKQTLNETNIKNLELVTQLSYPYAWPHQGGFAGDVLVMVFWCLVMYWWAVGDVLMVCWWYFGGVLVMFRWCLDDV